MSIYRAYVTYTDKDNKEIETRSVTAVELWSDEKDSEAQSLASLVRDAKKIGRLCWHPGAHRMCLDIVRHSPDAVIYNEVGIRKASR